MYIDYLSGCDFSLREKPFFETFFVVNIIFHSVAFPGDS